MNLKLTEYEQQLLKSQAVALYVSGTVSVEQAWLEVIAAFLKQKGLLK